MDFLGASFSNCVYTTVFSARENHSALLLHQKYGCIYKRNTYHWYLYITKFVNRINKRQLFTYGDIKGNSKTPQVLPEWIYPGSINRISSTSLSSLYTKIALSRDGDIGKPPTLPRLNSVWRPVTALATFALMNTFSLKANLLRERTYNKNGFQ